MECIALADQDRVLEDEVRLVIRTAARYKLEQQRKYISRAYFFGERRRLDNLVSHLDDMSEDEARKVLVKVNQIKAILDKVGIPIEKNKLMDIYMKCKVNCHLVIDHNEPEYLSRGRAVYLAASKLDHTCVPCENYTLMFNGRKVLIRAMKRFTLKDPSDLKIHYVPSNLSYADRRDRILKNYFFLCSCAQCVFQLRNPNPEDENNHKRAGEICDVLDRYDPNSKVWFEQATAILRSLEEISDEDFHVHWLLLHAQQAAAHLKLYSQSLEFGTRALRGATTVMGIQRILFSLLTCMKYLRWDDSNSSHIENFHETKHIAKRLFTITHGKEHSIVKMVCAPVAVEKAPATVQEAPGTVEKAPVTTDKAVVTVE